MKVLSFSFEKLFSLASSSFLFPSHFHSVLNFVNSQITTLMVFMKLKPLLMLLIRFVLG